jgi:O-Antigen ligase
MPTHLRAFAYIAFMTIVMFALIRKPITASLVSDEDFKRRRNAWFVITAAAFLSHNFWVFVCITAAIAWYTAQRDRNPLALFVSLLFLVPLFQVPIPGFGIVNYLFMLDHQRALTIVLLVPLVFRWVQSKEPVDPVHRVVHAFVLMYWAMVVVNYLIYDSPTEAMRAAVVYGLSAWVLYYAAARGASSVRQLRETMLMYVMAMSVLGIVGFFEMTRGWQVYESLRSPLGGPTAGISMFIVREGGFMNFLRAMVTGGHAIVLGYLMMIGVVFWVALRGALMPKKWGLVVLAGVALGSVSAMSRGPWLGLVVALLVTVLTGPGMVKRLGLVLLTIVAIVAMLLVLPFGDAIIAFLPFVGTVETGNIDYRQRLFEVSMVVFRDNPWLGNFLALKDPRMEEMRQGQGIIDIVNSYVGIGLSYGILGLALFIIPFLIVMFSVLQVARKVEVFNPTVGLTGRALLGATVGILVVIGTASSIEYVPVVYWLMLGFCTSYVTTAKRVVLQHEMARAQATQFDRQVPMARPVSGVGLGRPSPTSR